MPRKHPPPSNRLVMLEPAAAVPLPADTCPVPAGMRLVVARPALRPVVVAGENSGWASESLREASVPRLVRQSRTWRKRHPGKAVS